ncbi:DUF418 domain-containing protein [Nonomuraea insulae]|uniref:DUF418 domain-containing protein n=1 Tax=Nonomuraea insulae TaxID=1616787 RepID=A0ABW1D8T9_9ACTN
MALLRRLVVLAAFGALHHLAQPGEALLPYAIFGVLFLLPASYLPRAAVLGFGAAGTVGALVGGLVLAVPMTLWYLDVPLQERVFGYGAPIAAIAGLSTAMVYIGAFLLWLRTRAGAAAGRVLAPLGRMALTNYVTATAIVLVVMRPLGLVESQSYGIVFVLAVAIIALQAAFSAWWLSHWRYGPLEWLWRCGTWWQAVPNNKTAPVDVRSR